MSGTIEQGWVHFRIDPIYSDPYVGFFLLLLPYLLYSLFRLWTTSPVVLTHNPAPVCIDIYDHRVKTTRAENLIEYVKRKCPSLSDPSVAKYQPTLWMLSGHLQTAYAAFRHFDEIYRIDYERQLLSTEDGGTVSLDWAPSFSKKPVDATPTLVLLHGLTGGSHESYIRALVEELTTKHGYRCVVFNARACAKTALTSPQLYCGSWTEDIRMAVKVIREKLPEAKLMSVGFSLGANILMNYMGEEGDQCEFLGAMSVANPFDLMGTCYAMERGFLGKKIYSPTMGGNLRRIFLSHAKIFENHDLIDLDSVRAGVTIRDFDERVTRRVFKYRTVNEYYRNASSSRKILDIRRPFLCLNAVDDPIAVGECLPLDEVRTNPFGLFATTGRGGHLGWFEGFWTPRRWCTQPLVEYCKAIFEADMRSLSETPKSRYLVEQSVVAYVPDAVAALNAKTKAVEEDESDSTVVVDTATKGSSTTVAAANGLQRKLIKKRLVTLVNAPVELSAVTVPNNGVQQQQQQVKSLGFLLRLLRQKLTDNSFWVVVLPLLAYLFNNRRRR